MSGMLLQLSLCIMTVIQLTSSESSYNIFQQDDGICDCGLRQDENHHQLMTSVSQLQ